MGADNNQLRQKLLQKYNYFSSYCNNIKTKEDFLLSKQEIEKGLHEDSKTLFQLRQELFDLDHNRLDFDNKGVLKRAIVPKIRSLDGYKLSLLDLGMEANPHSRQEEELQINYYYNNFVYAMTHVISLALFFDEKRGGLEWDSAYSFAYKRIGILQDISGEYRGGDYYVFPEWNYLNSLCFIIREEPQMLFGNLTYFTDYKPKTNPTIQEMLEWMDIADGILKKERNISNEQENERDESVLTSDEEITTQKKKTDSINTNSNKEEVYDKKSTYITIVSMFFVFVSLLIDSRLFLFISLFIIVFGLRRAFNIKAEEKAPIFSVDNGIRERIKQAIEKYNMHIEVPFYGLEKVSDDVVDEVYHFFKDKKTQFEVHLTTIKEFELPYDEMGSESLYIMDKRYKEYEEKEKEGFAELQKIKAYGMVLEDVK